MGKHSYIGDPPQFHHRRAKMGSLFHTLTKWITTNYWRNIDWLLESFTCYRRGRISTFILMLSRVSRLLTLSFRSCYISVVLLLQVVIPVGVDSVVEAILAFECLLPRNHWLRYIRFTSWCRLRARLRRETAILDVNALVEILLRRGEGEGCVYVSNPFVPLTIWRPLDVLTKVGIHSESGTRRWCADKRNVITPGSELHFLWSMAEQPPARLWYDRNRLPRLRHSCPSLCTSSNHTS